MKRIQTEVEGIRREMEQLATRMARVRPHLADMELEPQRLTLEVLESCCRNLLSVAAFLTGISEWRARQ